MTTLQIGGIASLRIPVPMPSVTTPRRPRPRETVMVHLRNVDQHVTLYRDDYDRVVAELSGARWSLNSFEQYSGSRSSYVRAWSPVLRHKVMIARIVAQAPDRTAVRYLDGNPLNLRRENLDTDTIGGAGGVKKRPKGTVNVMETREKRRVSLAAIAASKGFRHGA